MSKQYQNRNNSKKAAVLQNQKSRKNPITIVLCAAITLVIGAAAYYITGNTAPSASVAAGGNSGRTQVSYPVSMFDDGSARHFELKANGLTVRYFILKSSDGIIRAAFDACDVCWPAGKGYFQDGDNMVCRNCGRQFPSVRVNEVKGGCNPAPLNRTVQGDQLILKVEDILQGKSYFNFKERA